MDSVKRIAAIFFVIGLLIVGLSTCTNNQDRGRPDIRGETYADASTCVSCHRSIAESYLESSHFHTSSDFKGSEAVPVPGQNTFNFDKDLKVVIEKRGNKIFQVAYSGDTEVEAHSFDITFGSGEKAQTYGYWTDDGLFQLPLSYYTTIQSWANSPGFPEDKPHFQRAIISRCLECHSSFAENKLVKTGPLSVVSEVVKGSVLYGIDCQRCHGPAAKHVEFHLDNPEVRSGRFLPTFRDLSRQQKIDNCAVCHSGNDQRTQQSTFAFKPGDTLSNYYYPQYSRSKPEDDVHGKQLQMMASSACFIKSDMDCSTCHDPHRSGKELTEVLTQKCLNCHNANVHPQQEKFGKAILSNCIDCHMPLHESRQISFQIEGEAKKSPYLLRNHKIAVYPDATAEVIRYLEAL